MSSQTPNLELIQPEITDVIGQTIIDIASNAGKLDTAHGDLTSDIKALNDNLAQLNENLLAMREELDGFKVVEFDSSETGSYVRWANGFQICWGIIGSDQFPDNLTPTGSIYYSGSGNYIELPAKFRDTNSAVTSLTIRSYARWGNGYIGGGGDRLYFVQYSGSATQPYAAEYTAIGRWK